MSRHKDDKRTTAAGEQADGTARGNRETAHVYNWLRLRRGFPLQVEKKRDSADKKLSMSKICALSLIKGYSNPFCSSDKRMLTLSFLLL